jgi:nucleotide-binding universal stress UspA family protein
MKHIVVPIDFSEESLNGLELAIVLSGKTRASVQMVYVQKKSSDYFPGSHEEESRWAKKKFEEIVGKYEHKLASPAKLSYIIKQGKIFLEVVNQASAFEESVIVASTHGGSGFEEFFIGSNAFKIVTASNNPVITIRHGVDPKPFRKILLPIDVNIDTRQKVPFSAELAKYFDAELHIVTLSSLKGEDIKKKLLLYAQQVQDFLNDKKLKSEIVHLVGDDLAGMVMDYARKKQIDLISITTEQGKGMKGFMLGTYAQQILNTADIPVLCISPRDIRVTGGFRTQAG